MARPSKPKEEVTPFIVPLIQIDGQKHDLEKIMEESPDDMPEMTGIGFMHLNKGHRHAWISYKMTVKGTKVLKMEVSEPDMKAIAEENAKIDFVSTFMEKEFE